MKDRRLNITFISSIDSFFSIYKIAKSTAAEHYIFFNQKDQVHPNSYAGYLALKAQYLHLENKTKINIETHTKYLRHLKRFETIGNCSYNIPKRKPLALAMGMNFDSSV